MLSNSILKYRGFLQKEVCRDQFQRNSSSIGGVGFLSVEGWASFLDFGGGETVLVLRKSTPVSDIVVVAGDWVSVDWVNALDNWSPLLGDHEVGSVVEVGSHGSIMGMLHSVIVIARLLIL